MSNSKNWEVHNTVGMTPEQIADLATKNTRKATRQEKISKPAVYEVPVNKPKKGRPSIFSQEIANEICNRLAEGESLRSICSDKDMPDRQTIYTWLSSKKDFLGQYARAREEQADTLADEIIAIADEQPEVIEVRDKDGNIIDHKLDSAFLAWQKNRIDARKWTAMKLKPKKYGDKLVHAGDDDNPVVVENNLNVFGELLKSMKMARQAE